MQRIDRIRDGSLRLIIADPAPHYADGGWPEKFDLACPGHLEAKTPSEMKALAFRDGKNLSYRFNELKFFIGDNIYSVRRI